MNRFEKAIHECMVPAEELLERTEKPLHQAILRNFIRHVHLEGSGQYDEILGPEMMVDEPVYRINWGQPLVLRGKDEVRGFYESAGRFVMWNSEDRIAVADWGICDELTFNFLTTGTILGEFGIEVDDKDGHYHYTTRQAFIWPYDGQGRLAGEHLYVDSTTTKVEPVDPAEVITPERSAEIHRELLARL
jgi:hypothetical protein